MLGITVINCGGVVDRARLRHLMYQDGHVQKNSYRGLGITVTRHKTTHRLPSTLGREGNGPLCLGGISCAYDVVCQTIPLALSPTS
jgi:hypothetical protein